MTSEVSDRFLLDRCSYMARVMAVVWLPEDWVKLETTLFWDIWKNVSQSKPADSNIWNQAICFRSSRESASAH